MVFAADAEKKVKVFILAGQSNMQGKGSASHLQELAKSDPARYGYTVKGDQWAERDDVWCFFGSLSVQILK